jgi:hypothetical protein
MEFTAQESKLIDRLRKQERLWPRMRWFCIGAALIVFVTYICLGIMLFKRCLSGGFSTAEVALFVALFWPKALMMMGFAGVAVGIAIRDWHGNANRMLLLKLLDAQQKERGSVENKR